MFSQGLPPLNATRVRQAVYTPPDSPFCFTQISQISQILFFFVSHRFHRFRRFSSDDNSDNFILHNFFCALEENNKNRCLFWVQKYNYYFNLPNFLLRFSVICGGFVRWFVEVLFGDLWKFAVLRLYGFTVLRLYGYTVFRLYGFTVSLRLFGRVSS